MKKIEFTLQSESLVTVSNTLISAGIMDITVSQVRKFNQPNGQIPRYRGLEFTVNLLTKTKVEVVVDDSQVNLVLEKIRTAIPQEEIDGKILIVPIEEVSSSQILTQTLEMAQG